MDSRITKALNHIENNLAAELSLAHLAEVVCLSPSQFHRLFKIHTGYTPFKFIEKMRLNHAYQLLISEPRNIQALSEDCGYKDYETFSRAFKKMYCLSPDDLAAIAAQIRQQYTAEDEIYVAALSEFDATLIQQKFKELTEQLGIAADQLQETSVFLVNQVNSDSLKADGLVKNKYKIANDKMLWQLLMEPDTRS